jgi:hypothetical protein
MFYSYKYQPLILVLTLYSGENELDQCIESLQNQFYQNFEHQVFRFLPNVEAHQTLYGTIQNKKNEYDLFVKLDADMVFRSKEALADIVNIFHTYKNLDHAIFGVRDWYSGLDIVGMHAFSNNVTWKSLNDNLFVDPSPYVPGRRIRFLSAPSPIADHSPNPSTSEAYSFGWHRALKIMQRNSSVSRRNQSVFHYNLLYNVWKQFVKSKDMRRGVAIYGAEQAFSSNLSALHDKSNLDIEQDSKIIQDFKYEDMYKSLKSSWSLYSFLGVYRKMKYIYFWKNVLSIKHHTGKALRQFKIVEPNYQIAEKK